MKSDEKVYAWISIVVGVFLTFVATMAIIESGKGFGKFSLYVLFFWIGIVLDVYGVVYLIMINSKKGWKIITERNEQLRKKNEIVRARIIGADSQTKTGSAVGRAIVGNFVAGGIGAVVGASTARKSNKTKFLVEYADGSKKVETIMNNSARFKKLVKYLDM